MVQDVEDGLVKSLRKMMITMAEDIETKTVSNKGRKIIEDFVTELQAVDTSDEDKAIQEFERISGEFKIKAQKENECSTEHN